MRGGLRLAAVLCACAFFAGTSSALAARETIAPSNAWPQTHSDIPADPSIVFGTLPNGMRYLIKHNEKPAHGVSLSFRIAAGSLEETDSEEGLAHLLEHMAFRGSNHLRDGEAVKMLASVGAALGPDSNAYTYPDSTVFTFDFPGNDSATLDKAFLLTRDIATELTLDPKTVDSERKVVLAELRQGDTAVLHMSETYMSATYGNRLAEAMRPRGKVVVVQNATATQLRKFYRVHYRPERTTIIVVGDIDPKAIEAEIKMHFSDWKDATRRPKPPVYTMPDPAHAPVFKLFSEPGAGAAMQLTWASPFDTTPRTIEWYRRGILRSIAVAILNQRLAKLGHSDKPPFVGAVAGYGPSFGALDLANITVYFAPDRAPEALRAVHDAYVNAARNGVHQDEVNLVVGQVRTGLQATIAAYKTLPNNSLMPAFLIAIGLNQVIASPEQGNAMFEDVAKNLTTDQITAALRTLFTTSEPVVFVSSPAPLGGGEAPLAAAFAAPTAVPTIETASTATSKVWPYTDFGPAGTIAAPPRTVADIGATFVTFANGVRATIKPTKFLAGQVEISVRIGLGKMGLPTDRKYPIWALTGFVGYGLNRVGPDDLPKILAGKQVGAASQLGESAFLLNGGTRTADFDTELQLLAAEMTDPAWRPQDFQRMQSAMLNVLGQTYATPDGMFGMNFWSIPHDNDNRWLPPATEDVQSAHLEDVKALVQDALANGPVEVIVVGDITVDDAIKGLSATFGALPKRHIATAPFAGAKERMPSPQESPFVLHYQGNGEQAVAMMSWPTVSMYPDLQTPRTLRVLEKVLSLRLFDELRSREGMTYTPQTQTANSMATIGWGFIGVYANIPTAKISNFYDAVAKVTADLKSNEISVDELERARGPLVGDLEHAQQNNAYWLAYLSSAQIDPRMIEYIRTDVPDLQKVTAADVLHAAQTYLSDDKAWQVIVVPQNYTVPATGH